MYEGVVIYLFDKDLTIRSDGVEVIEEIDFYCFSSMVITREDIEKADLIIYISDKFQSSLILKSRY